MTDTRAAPASSAPEFWPIATYGMLADGTTAALVSEHGSVDWLCFPRFDSPSLFARILDPAGGHWSMRPLDVVCQGRRYVPGTLIIETTFDTPTGSATLTDALGVADGQRGHDLGLSAPHRLLRIVRGRIGQVEMLMEFAPRPEYGLVRPQLRHDGSTLRAAVGSTRLVLRAGAPLTVSGATAWSRFAISEGETVGFCLAWAPADGDEPSPCHASAVDVHIDDAIAAWRSWEEEHDVYEGEHRELVRSSARVLKGLSYRPTGAIVAAPTTSLPEEIGGVRNWDYRYAWVRDASLTLQALYIGACSDEAADLLLRTVNRGRLW